MIGPAACTTMQDVRQAWYSRAELHQIKTQCATMVRQQLLLWQQQQKRQPQQQQVTTTTTTTAKKDNHTMTTCGGSQLHLSQLFDLYSSCPQQQQQTNTTMHTHGCKTRIFRYSGKRESEISSSYVPTQ